MGVEVLGISTSPRANGNTDLLLRQALSGAESAGAHTKLVCLRDLNILPCVECNCCYSTGECKLKDDYQELAKQILQTERLILASPVFFMTVCAQAKILIDRAQCHWAAKHILQKPLISGSPRDRRAMVIAVGGSKSKKMFECVHQTMKSYFDVLEIQYAFNLFVNKINEAGEIEKHPSAIKQAYQLGRRLVTDEAPRANETIDVELV